MTAYRDLYMKHWDRLETYRRSEPTISPPLLVQPPDAYWTQPVRLCVVGQETHTWYDKPFGQRIGPAAIDYLLDIYRNDFALGVRYSSPFWSTVRQLERGLGVAPGAVVWLNLNKVDQDSRRPTHDVEAAVRDVFPVVQEEIRLAQPNAVIFFTGPRYDALLSAVFPGALITPVTKFLATVAHESLPPISIRTYHPRFLRMRKVLKGTIEEILERIKSEPTFEHNL